MSQRSRPSGWVSNHSSASPRATSAVIAASNRLSHSGAADEPTVVQAANVTAGGISDG